MLNSAKTTVDQDHDTVSVNTDELAVLGLNAIAYAKWSDDAPPPGVSVGPAGGGYSIHAANGLRIGWAPSLDLAHMAIRQHEMEPMTLH